MAHKLPTAQPKLNFIPPAYAPWVVKLSHLFLPLMMRVRLQPWLPAGLQTVDVLQAERAVQQFQQLEAGQARFLFAFRHVEVDDPLACFYLLSRAIPQAARQAGVKLRAPVHSHFVYDRGMPLWAGAWLGWYLSKIGGIPIHRGRRLDLQAIKTVRSLLINGELPLAIAPEGATNGHSERMSTFEPGGAQLAFWCVEDLRKAGRSEAVYMLPMGIQYFYPQPNWSKLDRLLKRLEHDCGLEPLRLQRSAEPDSACYYARLLYLGEHLLIKMEQFYQRFYHRALHPAAGNPLESEPGNTQQPQAAGDRHQILQVRLQVLLDQALKVSEEFFGIASQGQLGERCRRIEEASWQCIYRQDLADTVNLSPLDQGLADWSAQAASLRSLHMRLVESFTAVSSDYVHEKPSFERLAETTLLIFDVIERIKGKSPRRPQLGWRRVQITIGEPLSVSDRFEAYKSSHQGAKQAIAALTEDLHTALSRTIKS
ncbi:MAG: 1-acyl-sn-glycerol-3-phosphate acyltransferase [Cyanobacteria bacterium P01_H01_bin.121]